MKGGHLREHIRVQEFVWVHVSARCLFGVFASFAWALPFALGGSTGRSLR